MARVTVGRHDYGDPKRWHRAKPEDTVSCPFQGIVFENTIYGGREFYIAQPSLRVTSKAQRFQVCSARRAPRAILTTQILGDDGPEQETARNPQVTRMPSLEAGRATEEDWEVSKMPSLWDTSKGDMDRCRECWEVTRMPSRRWTRQAQWQADGWKAGK